MHSKSPIKRQIANFLQYLEVSQNKSPKTIENYSHYLKRFSEFVAEDLDVRDIDLKKINNYRIYLNRFLDTKNRPLCKTTQNYHVIAIRAFLKYLAKHDIKSLAPNKIDLHKSSKRTVEVLSREEVRRLFNAVDKTKISGYRDTAILETLYSTGLRVSELVALNRDKVDLKRREFMVRGKGDKPRIVFLSKRAVKAISEYIRLRDDNFSPLFINSGKGARITDVLDDEKRRLSTVSIEKFVRKYALKAGIIKKATPHTLRHSYATELLINGADIRSVQEMLGHSSITTTQVYTHVTNKKLREIHDKYHR